MLTRDAPIPMDADTEVSSSKTNSGILRLLLSKTLPRHGISKRDQATRDQSTASTIQETEDSLDGTEGQDSSLFYENMDHSYNYVSSSQSFSILEPCDDPYADQLVTDLSGCTRRHEIKEDGADGKEKRCRRNILQKQENQRLPTRRRNSITVVSSVKFETKGDNEDKRLDLEATSQHSTTMTAARSDRRRTTRPRRHSLGYTAPALIPSKGSSEFKEVMQKRLDRIEKHRPNSSENSYLNIYGYEGEEWHDSSSHMVADLQGKRRCGRRACRHSIGNMVAAEDLLNVSTSDGTTCVDDHYGYEDPDCPRSNCNDSVPAGRQVRNAPRRTRRLSAGHGTKIESNDDSNDFVVDKLREPVQRRERRRSMHV